MLLRYLNVGLRRDGSSLQRTTDARDGDRLQPAQQHHALRRKAYGLPGPRLTGAQRRELATYLASAVLHADALIAYRRFRDNAALCGLRDELQAARERGAAGDADDAKLLSLLRDVANEWFGLGIESRAETFYERRQRKLVARDILHAVDLLAVITHPPTIASARR